MDTTALIKAIVRGQQSIIGPVAIDQANRVAGLNVSADLSKISFNGDNGTVLENLVRQYEKLFGRASVEACKESVREMGSVSSKDLPTILQ
jgi:hypothetical protein